MRFPGYFRIFQENDVSVVMMAENDLGRKQVFFLITKYGVFPAATLMVYYFIYRKKDDFKSLQRRVFAFMWKNFSSQQLRNVLDPVKEQLFSQLNSILSKDASLASKGSLRILEIGVGDGANFKFYPNGTHLVSVEPNPYFEKYFKQHSESFPNIVIEKFIRGSAEDMSEVPSGSVDAVVSTHVLCSVSDLDQSMREIRRVLVCDGKLFFLEHVSFKDCRSSYALQVLIQPFWKLLSDGCRLTHSSESIGQFPGMTIQYKKELIIQGVYHVMKPHVVGVSVKVSPDDD